MLRSLGLIATTLLATPALAQGALPLTSAFGNAAGCAYFMSGEVFADDLLLLTPDTLVASETGCDFVTLVEHTREVFTVSAVCSAVGQAGGGDEQLRVHDRGTDGLWIERDGEPEWGPFLPCPGTEGFFAPLGVQV